MLCMRKAVGIGFAVGMGIDAFRSENRKERNKMKGQGKNRKVWLLLLLAAAAVCAALLLLDVRLPQDYYGQTNEPSAAAGTVTMSIVCTDVVGKTTAEHIPQDGILLAAAAFPIEEGETAFSVLTRATQANEIHLESEGAPGMRYVTGIGQVYSGDFGEMSGWLYWVNGEMPSVGCEQLTLKDGDVIEWVYICDMSSAWE